MNKNFAQIADEEDATYEKKARAIDVALCVALLLALLAFAHLTNFVKVF